MNLVERGAEPFTISIAEGVLDDLRDRVRRMRWPDAVDGAGWEFGTDAAYLRELAAYWADGFDWRAQERLLNNVLPSWMADVNGMRVHFSHCAARGPAPIPIVLIHGWPGSFFEMYKLAPMLADPASFGGDPADAFDVFVPSLPSHGFSEHVLSPGVGADQCAGVINSLMTDVLGVARFGAQGGDRGAFVCAGLGKYHRSSMMGIHLNMPGGIAGNGDELTDEERAWQAESAAWAAKESGYSAIQGTKPQTLGFAMNDSPVGLLAWIVEKWKTWSDCGGDIEMCFTKDELLTNATIYWVTGTIRSSMHMYLEHRRNPPVANRPERIDVPTGVAVFPLEITRPPRSAVERKYDLRRWMTMPAGGHFAAMEQPVALAEEVRSFFRPLRAQG